MLEKIKRLLKSPYYSDVHIAILLLIKYIPYRRGKEIIYCTILHPQWEGTPGGKLHYFYYGGNLYKVGPKGHAVIWQSGGEVNDLWYTEIKL